MSTRVATPRTGLPVLPVVLAGALAGTFLGLGLSARHQATLAEEAEDVSALAGAATLGGDPDLPTDSMAPDPDILRRFPPYPGAYPRRMLKSALGPRQRMTMAWFEVEASAVEVVEYYHRRMAQEGLMPVRHMYDENVGYAGWYLHAKLPDGGPTYGDGLMHLVSVFQEAGRTLVFLSISEPHRMLMEGFEQPLPDGLRLPEGGTHTAFDLGEVPQASSVFHVAWPDRPSQELEAYLTRFYEEAGWKVVEKQESPERWSLVVARGGRTHVAVVERTGTGSELILTTESGNRGGWKP